MTKPKILMLLTEYLPIFSGHAIYLDTLLPFFKQKNYLVKILANDFNRLPAHEEINGILVDRIRFYNNNKHWELRQSFAILKYLFKHRNNFDILHFHGHMDHYGLLALFCKLFKKRSIMQMVLVGTDDPLTIRHGYKLMWFRFKLFLQIDSFICISKALVNTCQQANIPENKIFYIPQGVDTTRFYPVTNEEKQLLRIKLHLPADASIVVFIGAIIHRKGVDILIDAWKRIQPKHADALLLLVGPDEFNIDDTNQKALETFVLNIRQQIADNNLRVTMTGQTDMVDQFLKASDIFAFPSRKEGFGNVIIEAMACGLPAVISNMDGVSAETVEQGADGFVVNDTIELQRSLERLLLDESLRIRMGNNGRKKAVDVFKIETIAERYLDLYRTIH